MTAPLRLMQVLRTLLPPAVRILLLAALLLALRTGQASATPLDGKNILVLHSYHQTFNWTDQQMEGIIKVFHAIDPSYMPFVEHLDWKRFPDEERIAAFRETLRSKYRGIMIDAVIVTDNKALDFALANRAQLFPAAAISFCGINNYTDAMIRGHERISGVAEDVDPAGTIGLIAALLPETREIVVLLDDTESSNGVLAAVEQAMAGNKTMTLRVVRSPAPDELISLVGSLGSGSVLLQGPYLRDRTGRTFSYENVLERIRHHSNVPIFSLWEFLAGRGITGGSLLSGNLQGENAARIALRLLDGETAVPVMTKSPSRTLLDYRQLQRFGLEKRLLSAGVEVIERPSSFAETYFKTIVAGLITMAVLVAIIVALVIAIRKRKLVERRLRESEERYRLLMDNVPLGINLMDSEYRIVMVNRTQARMFGHPPEWFKGRHCYVEFEKRTEICPHCPGALSMASGDNAQMVTEGIRDDGSRFTVNIRTVPLKGTDGKTRGFIEVVEDITEHRRAEQERLNLEQQLLHAQKLESLGVLAGGIAHDFNNILMAIIGNADLALMRLSPESPAVGNLHNIEQSAARAADLAKQMLAYSGKGKFVIEHLDLNRLLEEMLHMLEVSISKKAVLRLDLTRPLPSVEADATQMRQIVMNLVINASEAIGDRSGVIAITTGCMDCDRSYLKNVWLDENITEGLYLFLEIADTGCGMDREVMSKIFDPFFTTKFTGRGLGMAAVLGIVRGHKGAIRVYSEPNRGTTFKILLPASGRPLELFNEESHKHSWKGSGTVLLVDDEETVRAIGSEMLKELGFMAITANDGREALDIFRSNPDIAIVVLDLTMPHMDGEQCFRELRLLKPDVKVIMSSGYNEHEVTQKFVGKGLAGFVQKPYKVSTLREVFRGLIEI